MVSIEGKSVGSRKKLFDSFSVPLVDLQSPAATANLQNLIENIVADQVRIFSIRQHESQLLKILTNKEITQGIYSGKVSSGLSETAMQAVDLTEAIAAAIEAFTDGLFFVFIDSEQINTLEEPISLKADSRIMFVRLTLIAGG